MEKSIRMKTATYTVAAILLAIILGSMCFYFGIQPRIPLADLRIKTFSNYEELENFLASSMEQAKSFGEQYLMPFRQGGEIAFLDAEVASAPAHSTTNIQVAGVDEADIVKTDGEFLYAVSGGDILILKAYPPEEASVLSKITLEEMYNPKLYVNGSKLAILGGHFSPTRSIYTYGAQVCVMVYDISNITKPTLARTFSINGTISGSRMIGNYIYATVAQPAVKPNSNQKDLEVALPKISVGDNVEEIPASEIRYVDAPDLSYSFTTVIAMNLVDDAQEATHETFLTGSTACMYVSQNNMYLTAPNTNYWISPVDGGNGETNIYRIRLDLDRILLEAEGSVSGYVLNQFSMDEHEGFFRIATTKWTAEGSTNNLYILDPSLKVVGELEGLAPGERVYSARFMGDRCYLVTFEEVDPFFVIDLSTPTQPGVLGYLKIPGFSGYLHPYGENHVIGVGAQENDVKLSLFNVTDVTAPTETAKYIVQADWSSTTVLTDHKAFLFDKAEELLALPITEYLFDTKNGEQPFIGYRQGAYIFNVTLEHGFRFEDNITHQEDSADYSDYRWQVQRILYIGDVLYTISEAKVKMNDMATLQLINEIDL